VTEYFRNAASLESRTWDDPLRDENSIVSRHATEIAARFNRREMSLTWTRVGPLDICWNAKDRMRVLGINSVFDCVWREFQSAMIAR